MKELDSIRVQISARTVFKFILHFQYKQKLQDKIYRSKFNDNQFPIQFHMGTQTNKTAVLLY